MNDKELNQIKRDLIEELYIDNSNISNWFKLSSVEYQLGNIHEAIEALRKANCIDESDYKIISMLVEYMLECRRYDEAIKYIKELILHERSYINLYNLGVSLYNQGYYEEAEFYFLEACSDEEEGDDYNASLYVAYARAHLGKKELSLQIASQLRHLLVEDVIETIDEVDIAFIYYLNEEYEKAKELLDEVLSFFYLSGIDLEMCFYVMYRLNHINESKKYLDRIIAEDEESIANILADNDLAEELKRENVDVIKSKIQLNKKIHKRISSGAMPKSKVLTHLNRHFISQH